MRSATVLMGCYPDLGKVDPEIYTRMLHSLFMEYPEADVMRVVKDLPRQSKWLPAIAEIQAALDPPPRLSSPSESMSHSYPYKYFKFDRDVEGATPERRAEVAGEVRNTVQEWRSQQAYERRAAGKWSFDPSKAFSYPMEWLLLTKEERWAAQDDPNRGPKPKGWA